MIIDFFLVNRFLSFRATEIECCSFFLSEYNIGIESTIRSTLYSSRPIRLRYLYVSDNAIYILDCSFKL